MKLHKIPPRNARGYHVVIESPRGSRVKMKYEPSFGAFVVARVLPLGHTYPFDWGFIPGTRGPDGDPVDVLVYWDAATFAGAVIECRLIGALVLDQEEDGERVRNDRVIAVPLEHGRSKKIHDVDDLAASVRDDLAEFFTSSIYFTAKDPRVLGWCGAKDAVKIAAGRRPRARSKR